jgi:hypothetical protein
MAGIFDIQYRERLNKAETECVAEYMYDIENDAVYEM